MKRICILIACLGSLLTLHAQVDSTFVGRLENKDLMIFLDINFVEKNIEVPGQEVLGELDGYIGHTKTANVWAIVSSEIDGNKATLELVNNYGSEDFQALLTREPDGSYTLKHKGGSTLKFPVNGKWQKIPTKVTLQKK